MSEATRMLFNPAVSNQLPVVAILLHSHYLCTTFDFEIKTKLKTGSLRI